MRYGITTSATQIEGGNNRNSWWEWATRGNVKDGADPYVACEHFNRVEQDAELVENLGVKSMRLGLEWARIEPEKGHFDAAAMAHYVDEISLLKAKGIVVMVTLHHFTNPVWFENSGGFEQPNCWVDFSRYAGYAANALYGLVTDFITFNQPNTYCMNGYVHGIYPPGVKKKRRAKKVMANLCACHIWAYGAIHAAYAQKNADKELSEGACRNKESKTEECPAKELATEFCTPRVSVALQYKVLQPKYRSSLADAISNRNESRLYQYALAHGMFKGEFGFTLGKPKGVKIQRGKYYDFIAVNYFTRTVVNMYGHGVKEDVPVSDIGIEIFPQGLSKVLRAVRSYFQNAPIIIAANGVADRRDAFRCRFIYEHLKAIEECGVEVEAYYYYTLMDCFEWANGITAKYGLYETDFGSQERKLRRSGEFYRELNRAGKMTDELRQKYVDSQSYENN